MKRIKVSGKYSDIKRGVVIGGITAALLTAISFLTTGASITTPVFFKNLVVMSAVGAVIGSAVHKWVVE